MTHHNHENSARMFDFDTIKVGDEATLTHLLTQADVDGFAALTGDFNPLHVDEEFAKTTSFQKPLVHGMLSAGFISTMIGMLLPGRGALWMSQTIEFLRPAFVGDTIDVRARVKQKSAASRILALSISVNNQHGDELINGEATVKMLEVKKKGDDCLMEKNPRKNILVTGGSRGIGAAAAIKLANDGHAIIINYMHDRDKAEAVVAKIANAGGKAVAIKADIADTAEVEALFHSAEKAFGPVQALVHCATPSIVPQPFAKLNWAAFQEQINVHLKGAFNCAKSVLPKMIETRSGDLVFIGTIAADGVPPPQQAQYITAKSALTSLAKCLAVEYSPLGIRINVVAPGMTQTDLIANMPDKAKMLTKMQTPLRILAEPVDIANVIAFLLSPGARHITGETIRVCGGAVMQ